MNNVEKNNNEDKRVKTNKFELFVYISTINKRITQISKLSEAVIVEPSISFSRNGNTGNLKAKSTIYHVLDNVVSPVNSVVRPKEIFHESL